MQTCLVETIHQNEVDDKTAITHLQKKYQKSLAGVVTEEDTETRLDDIPQPKA